MKTDVRTKNLVRFGTVGRVSRTSSISKRPAFTLIELLVVVAIIALLVAILVPALTKAKEMARRSVCAGNMHSVALSLNIYANNYGGSLPPWMGHHNIMSHHAESMRALLDMTSGSTYEIFDCPNVPGTFARELRAYLDPNEHSFAEEFFAPEYHDAVYTGYFYLFRAKGQDPEIATWSDGSMIASSITDPPDVPLVVDLASGGPEYEDGLWTHIGHMDGGGGYDYVQYWHSTGQYSTSGPGQTYQVLATLAGSNHAYLDGHVQWWNGSETQRVPGLGFWKPGPQP